MFMRPCFKIITCCWNEEKIIAKCLESICRQTYKNWKVAVVDDYSTDKTSDILKQFKDIDNIIVTRNEKHLMLRMKNILSAIKVLEVEDEDILVFLDGDDMFPNEDTLRYLASVYESEDVWVTWGSYDNVDNEDIEVFGKYKKMDCAYYVNPAPEDWDLREFWNYSHLKTTKYFLWRNIRDEGFRGDETGEYFSIMDDSFMYPLLEMAGPNHSKYIDRTMCVRTVFKNLNKKHYGEIHPMHADAIRRGRVERVQVIYTIPYPRRTKKELLENEEK